jgi:putative intracellular protease/amidase
MYFIDAERINTFRSVQSRREMLCDGATSSSTRLGIVMSKNILFIVTSNAHMGASGKATGIWAEELATPYYAMLDAGFTVDIASPKGGAVPMDPGSVKAAGSNSPEVDRFFNDASAKQKSTNSLRAADVNVANYDAVFFPGGHGTMWDLPVDAGVTNAVEAAFAANKVIASVCHGAAGLVTAKRADGRSIVAGKRVNSFTDAEEGAAGLTAVVPFLLETRIRELGGKFEGAANWQAFALRDGNLITGQNPQSSALVAQNVIDALRAA